MKIDSAFRVFDFFMAVLIFSMPVIIIAQQNPTETKAEIETEAKVQALIDAENDANKTVWFMRGCFLNIFGVALARRTKAPVPAGRLMGKSLTYIVAYTSAYQTRRSEIQVESTLLGCILGPLCCVGGCLVECIFSAIRLMMAVPLLPAAAVVGMVAAAAVVAFFPFGNWCAF